MINTENILKLIKKSGNMAYKEDKLHMKKMTDHDD